MGLKYIMRLIIHCGEYLLNRIDRIVTFVNQILGVVNRYSPSESTRLSVYSTVQIACFSHFQLQPPSSFLETKSGAEYVRHFLMG